MRASLESRVNKSLRFKGGMIEKYIQGLASGTVLFSGLVGSVDLYAVT